MSAAIDDMTTKAPPKGRLRENLARLRAAKGWTQIELQRRSGVGQSLVSRLESGKQTDTSWNNIEALARALGVSPIELAGADADAILAAEPKEKEPTVGRADVGELIRLYLVSEWYERDAPTPEEMRWLASLGVITWTGAPPTAGTVHVLLEEHRKGRI